MSSVISTLLLAALLGVITHSFERLWGTRLYRYVHDFFHKTEDALPATEERGILYNQSTNRKITIVSIAVLFYGANQLWTNETDLLSEIMTAIFGVPGFLLGFWIGTFTHPLILRRSDYFDSMDRVLERLRGAKSEDVKGVVAEAGSHLLSFLASLPGKLGRVIRGSSTKHDSSKVQPEEAVVPQTKDEPAVDPREAIDSYTRRRS